MSSRRARQEAGPAGRGGQVGRARWPLVGAAALGVVLVTVAVVALLTGQQPGGGVTTSPTGLAVPTAAPSADSATQTAADRPVRRRPAPAGRTAEDHGAPTWIRIAAGEVDGPIVPQGLSSDGTINPGRDEIIWFTGGDRVAPGEPGTAVIAAHVTWEGSPDAFVHLPEVEVGDVVTLGFEDGSARTFTVVETAAVDKEELARSLTVWGPHPRAPRLAIITCDPALGFGPDGHTEANYVVIAEG